MATAWACLTRSGTRLPKYRPTGSVLRVCPVQRQISTTHVLKANNLTSQLTSTNANPSRLEAAYLQNLLREAGVNTTAQSAEQKSEQSWRGYSSFLYFVAGFMSFGPVALILQALYMGGYIPFTDPETQAKLRAQWAWANAGPLHWKPADAQDPLATAAKAVYAHGGKAVIIGPDGMTPSASDIAEASEAAGYSQEQLPADAASSLAIAQMERELATMRLAANELAASANKEIKQTWKVVKRYKEIAMAQHKHLLELICNTDDSSSVVLDDALLASRPIKLRPSGKVLPAPKAALVRVLDAAGKNRMLILGVDLGPEVRKVGNWPDHCFGLHDWLLDLADELQEADATSERGIGLYCVSGGVLVDVGKRHGSRVTLYYDKMDGPAGFPLKQMRGLKNVQKPEFNLLNLGKVEVDQKDNLEYEAAEHEDGNDEDDVDEDDDDDN